MTQSRVLYPRLALHHQPDGSIVAIGEDLPLCVVARDEADLEAKLQQLGRAVDSYFRAVGAEAAVQFIEERGTRYVIVGMGGGDEDDRRQVPMLVSV